MPTIKLRIAATVPIHGKKPGETFDVEADSDGMPLPKLWRKRVADGGAETVSDTPPKKAAPAAPAAKERA